MTNAKEVFAELKKFFNDSNIDVTERVKVWNVLTALRGPDVMENEHIKSATTILIREQLLGTNHTNQISYPKFMPDNSALVGVRTRLLLSTEQRHFASHAYEAFNSLGLKWSKVNPN